MAEHVVDLLELVDVEVQAGQGMSGTAAPHQRVAQMGGKLRAVRQAGQEIDACRRSQAMLYFLEAGEAV